MGVLDEPLARVVGGKAATRIEEQLGLRAAGELLRHYPRRYIARGEVSDLGGLVVGDYVTVVATVERIEFRRMQRRPDGMAHVVVTDGRGKLELSFFLPARNRKLEMVLRRQLRPGTRALFAGEVGIFQGRRQLTHPKFEVIDHPDGDGADEIPSEVSTLLGGPFLPVYPATSALPSWTIARTMLTLLGSTVPGITPDDDPLPEQARASRGMLGLGDALRAIHHPQSQQDIDEGQRRLRFDEALVLQALLAQRRRDLRAVPATPRVGEADRLLAAFDTRLPFALTGGQQRVGAEIAADLARDVPMHRLLQGEVGSGKTLVALRAMLAVVDAGGQAALLAPTEVLAHQHHRTIASMLGDLAQGGMLGGATAGTRIALVTGSMGAQRRRRELLDIVSGDAGIVIGTHALLEERVEFHDLALVVVDEQHRFGVEQRAALAAKSRAGTRPHLLVMTATPIPRTVAMTVFGDLDVSTLDELPRGRAGVATHVVPSRERPHFLVRAWDRVREAVASGHQAYVVCPRIGEDSAAEDADYSAEDGQRPALAVLDVAPRLESRDLAGLRIGVLHGRMSAEDKDDTMRRFAEGPEAVDGLDVLVATTVIEVGVDVPNATVMVVLDADRFGISQLHQLRGRVGRGTAPGLCLLVTEADPGSPARRRLDAVASTSDGFELSRLDLELRREGDVLGAVQSGRRSSLTLLEVLRHEDVIVDARSVATAMVDADPALAEHPGMARAVAELAAADRADYLEKA